MPTQAFDFNHVGYHDQRLRTMSWDDRIASYILALNWSRTAGLKSEAPKMSAKKLEKRQRLSHVECVAVAYVDNMWYIASNRLELTDAEIVLAGASSIGCPNSLSGNYEIVRDGGDTMHAEMKILKRLSANSKLDQCDYIGVSKPCCPRCKEVLDNWLINYTSYHAVMPEGDTWIDPNLGVSLPVAVALSVLG
jgi:hypothetical protein